MKTTTTMRRKPGSLKKNRALSFFWACFTDKNARTFENQGRCLVAVYHSYGEPAMMWVEARINDGKEA